MNAESPRRGFCHVCQSSVPPYSLRSTIGIRSLEGCTIRWTYLARRAVFVCCSWRTPRPPCSIGRHTVSQATRGTARVSSGRDPHQKNLMSCSSLFRTPHGSRKIDIKHVGMVASTALSNTRCPPRDINRARHPPSSDSTFSSTGCQSEIRSRLSTSGTPR